MRYYYYSTDGTFLYVVLGGSHLDTDVFDAPTYMFQVDVKSRKQASEKAANHTMHES